MKLQFIGVGEALDPHQPNTSILVQPDGQSSKKDILLDCGFTVPHQYFRLNPAHARLDQVWISHFHGDHFLGVPLLVLRFWEMNRSEPLTFVGQKGIADKLSAAVELAYPGLLGKIGFPLDFMEISPVKPLQINDINWQTAFNDHSQPCLALRLTQGNLSVFYSGDGRPSPESLHLAEGCDLIIHEAYRFQTETSGHGSIDGCIDFALKAGAGRLALLHLHYADRLHFMDEIQNRIKQIPGVEILLPEAGDIIELK